MLPRAAADFCHKNCTANMAESGRVVDTMNDYELVNSGFESSKKIAAGYFVQDNTNLKSNGPEQERAKTIDIPRADKSALTGNYSEYLPQLFLVSAMLASGLPAEKAAVAAEKESAAKVERTSFQDSGFVWQDVPRHSSAGQNTRARSSGERTSPWGEPEPEPSPAPGEKSSPWGGKTTPVEKTQQPKPVEKTPPAQQDRPKPAEKSPPLPVYQDPLARDGSVELVDLPEAEAKKIIDSIPDLFLKEGRRELELLNARDASRPQVYVTQDMADFARKYPGLKAYASIQSALNSAPEGSVINVLPGPSSSSYPQGRPYSENVSIKRSNLVIRTNEKMPATISGGGFSIGSDIHDIKILNFNMERFSDREAAIRVEGENIKNIIVGGNYFYDATGAEAAGFYGTGKDSSEALKNLYLMANVIGKDRSGNARPLNISAKQLEATPFNGNVENIVAVGNMYHGTIRVPLNLGLDFIGGENVGTGQNNQARNGFGALNYAEHVGHPTRWAAGIGYIDGAANITQVYNMSYNSNFCGEIGAERPGKQARNNAFSGNICKDSSAAWIAVGAPSDNGASVTGSKVENNIVIGTGDSRHPHVQYKAGISARELQAKNLFYDDSQQVRKLPKKIVELYRYFY